VNLKKITALKAVILPGEKTNLHRRFAFAERLNALGAHNLFEQAAILQDGHLLQIGFEGPVGGAQGERAIMPESGRLTAICTFSHRTLSFR
jgi:hypothetical protein